MSPLPVQASPPTYRAEQTELFIDSYTDNPIISVLKQELSPAGFSALKKLGLHLERLIKEQQRKDLIRHEYFQIRAEEGGKVAFTKIMEAHNLEPDSLDMIIYPRIGK